MVPIIALIYPLFLQDTADACAVYLAQSKALTNGVGVFAGKNFSANELIDISHTLLIPKDPRVDTWTLANYVYGITILTFRLLPSKCLHFVATRHEDFSLVAFGVSMLLNHHNTPNTAHYTEQLADTYANERPKLTYTNGKTQKFETTRDVSAGEEFLTYYGENWFSYRQLSLVNLSTPQEEAISLEELEQTAVCLSDIYSESSVLLPDEKGVFTRVFISNGHLVVLIFSLPT